MNASKDPICNPSFLQQVHTPSKNKTESKSYLRLSLCICIGRTNELFRVDRLSYQSYLWCFSTFGNRRTYPTHPSLDR